MTKRMLIDASHPQETRVVVLDGDRINDFDLSTVSKHQIKGNIYLAKVTRVEPSLQAAFVEYGGGKQGFLPFAEIHPDYYQIPVSDRQRLMEEALADDGQPSLAAMYENEPLPGLVPLPAEGEAVVLSDQDAAAIQSAEEASAESAPYASLIRVLRSAPLQESSELLSKETVAHLEQEGTEYAAPAAEEVVAEDAAPTHTIAEDEVMVAAPSGDDQPAPEPEESASESDHIESVGSAEDEAVETIGDEDDVMQQEQRRRNSLSRRYRIQEVIRRGQIMLVQVIKEERGNKGVSLSTYISLAGRYCVLMPNSTKGGGISRKIAGSEHRKRLRELVAELSEPEGMSVIIRTAGIDRSTQDIRRDYDYLVRLWNQVRETTIESVAPALIHEEGDIIKRSIRDMYTSDIEEVIVAGAEGYHEARDFMEMLMPAHGGRVIRYVDAMPMFHRYGVEHQLASMYEPTARLRSGGYVVINPTEALISIDVNSGRSTGERNIEETARKTNLEAAEEIARQLRLRDLAGLIVIDFIDMMESRNRRAVERALKDALRTDRAKIQIGRISPFGLLELSRQRLRPSLAEASMITCPHCNGKGVLRADNTIAVSIIRALEHELALGLCDELRVQTSAAAALYVLNNYRKALSDMEARSGVAIRIIVSDKVATDGFQVERVGGSPIRDEQRRPPRERSERRERPERHERPDRHERAERTDRDAEDRPERAERSERAERGERSERGRRRRGGADRTQEPRPVALNEDGTPMETPEGVEPRVAGEEGENRRRRTRGGRRRRGGGAWEERDGAQTTTEAGDADAVAVEGSEGAEPTGERSDRPRRSRGGRNRRGGEGRRRREEGAPRAFDAENYVPEPGVVAEAPRSNPRWSEGASSAPAAAPTVMSFAPERPAPAPVAVQATAPAAASVSSSEPADADKPKRFGWWRKVME